MGIIRELKLVQKEEEGGEGKGGEREYDQFYLKCK